MPNNLELLNDEVSCNVQNQNIDITGKLNNHIDYSKQDKWVPLFINDDEK